MKTRRYMHCVVALATFLGGHTAHSQGVWQPQDLPLATNVRGIQAAPGGGGWIASTAPPAIYNTSDAGISWTRRDTAEFSDWLTYDIANAETGVILSASSGIEVAAILRSADEGISWSQAFRLEAPGAFINGIRMTSALEGVAIADPIGGSWVVLLTSDGGVTWHSAPSTPVQAMGSLRPEVGWEHSLAALPGGHIWFGTDNSRVYRSTDGGISWSYGTIPSFDAYGLAFTDPLTGVAACGNGLARTTDGGVTWTLIPAGTCKDVVGVNNMFWAVQGRDVLQSTDDGATWDTVYSGVENFSRIHAAADDGFVAGWAAGANGQLVRFDVTVSGTSRSTGSPMSIKLHQNYPNPFNPSTTIRYTLPARAAVTLTVFNVLGQGVSTLVEEEIEMGDHEAKFDASTLAGGVYLYRLRAGSFVEVRKMMLVK